MEMDPTLFQSCPAHDVSATLPFCKMFGKHSLDDDEDVSTAPGSTNGSPENRLGSVSFGVGEDQATVSAYLSQSCEQEGDYLTNPSPPQCLFGTVDAEAAGKEEDFSADDGENVDEEEETGACEEAEFSLDGRLATIKRWRSFRRQQDAMSQFPPGQLQSPAALAPPGFDTRAEESAPPRFAGALAPPGFSNSTQDTSTWESPASLHVDVGRLVETAPPWLEVQIRELSLAALQVDAWQALLHPEPDDPQWQLLALVCCRGLVGFGTYALFEEVGKHGNLVMSVHHVVVASTHRGRGCGRRIVAELQAKAKSAGAWAVKLYSTPSAVRFYEHLGFKVVGPNQLMELHLA